MTCTEIPRNFNTLALTAAQGEELSETRIRESALPQAPSKLDSSWAPRFRIGKSIDCHIPCHRRWPMEKVNFCIFQIYETRHSPVVVVF